MSASIVFEHEDAGRIEVRRPKWADFKSWADEFARDATRQDSYQNLWATLAVSPPAAEVPALIEDFSALPLMVAGALLTNCGTPSPGFEGLSERYAVRTLADAEAEHKRAAEITVLLGAPDDPLPEDPEEAAKEEKRRAQARRALQEEHAALWLIPIDTIAAAKKRSRRAFFVRTPAGTFALRPPGAEASSDYTAAVTAYGQGKKDSSFAEACRALVIACALSPEPAAVKAALEEYPAIAWCLAPELIDRAGAGKALVRVS